VKERITEGRAIEQEMLAIIRDKRKERKGEAVNEKEEAGR
jgi:hypothetical protein